MKARNVTPRDIPEMSPGLPEDARPYAITEGLSGLYMPNLCFHVRGLSEAREAMLELVERVLDSMDDPSDWEPLEEQRAEFVSATDEDCAQGWTVTFGYEEIALTPISEEDFEEDSNED